MPQPVIQITPKDKDLAGIIEDSKENLNLSQGCFYLERAVDIPGGVKVLASGGYADRGVGTDICKTFDGPYMFRSRDSGAIRDVSLTVDRDVIQPGAAFFLDGTSLEKRPTWLYFYNVVLPAYSEKNFKRFECGIIADGSPYQTSGSKGVRDVRIVDSAFYGCWSYAIDLKTVVNVNIRGCWIGPGGAGYSRVRVLDADLIAVSDTQLYGHLYVKDAKNFGWNGGRYDEYKFDNVREFFTKTTNTPKPIQ